MKFWLIISGNSSEKLHCGSVVKMPYRVIFHHIFNSCTVRLSPLLSGKCKSKRIIKNLYLHHILKTATAGFRPLSYLLPASPILERFHGPVIMCEYIYIFYIYMNTCIRGGTNIQSDPDTSDNRCSKPDPRYLPRLSAKVLISRITV